MPDDIFESVYEVILSRDTKYDGVYYVAIKTTGIFCRPSCRSRIPKRENVKVYGSIEEARQAGFRPCKRCRPDQPGKHGPDAETAHAALELIRSRYPEGLTLERMASALNMSPYHLHRVFKRTLGITPSRQLLQTRLDAAKELLAGDEQAIADIAAAVGFRSVSHFSNVFKKTVGCAPNEYREANGRTAADNRMIPKEESL